MTPNHLLPANATPLEQALSLSTDALSRLALPADAIRQFKTDPSDPLLPWLIWEYGLGELLPYLPEPRRAIAEGILWQRLRGTPKALAIALRWIGADHVFVEPEVPGVHFAEFQIDPGLVLDDDRLIADLIAIAKLSAPARSRLSRLYHGWDLRRVVLDESRLGEALLSDHSGVFWTDGQSKLSFGRVRKFAHPQQTIRVVPAITAHRFAVARLIDRYLLDFSALGDPGHTRNEEMLHAHLFTFGNPLALPEPLGMRPERKFCKAMVVLSDSAALGDINANLPRFVWEEQGEPFGLGKGSLSESDHRLRRVEVLARFYAAHPASALVPGLSSRAARLSRHARRAAVHSDWQLGHLSLGDTAAQPGQRAAMARLSALNNLLGRRWVDQLAWPAARWRDLWREPEATAQAGFLPERRFCKAQIVLSEVRLGWENSRTPRRAIHRTKPVPRLGELALGDAAEIEWRALTDMQICTSALTTPTPYAISAPYVERHRLLRHAVLHGVPLGVLRLGETGQRAVVVSLRDLSRINSAAWRGQTWTGVTWPTDTWHAVRELIVATHSTT